MKVCIQLNCLYSVFPNILCLVLQTRPYQLPTTLYLQDWNLTVGERTISFATLHIAIRINKKPQAILLERPVFPILYQGSQLRITCAPTTMDTVVYEVEVQWNIYPADRIPFRMILVGRIPVAVLIQIDRREQIHYLRIMATCNAFICYCRFKG